LSPSAHAALQYGRPHPRPHTTELLDAPVALSSRRGSDGSVFTAFASSRVPSLCSLHRASAAALGLSNRPPQRWQALGGAPGSSSHTPQASVVAAMAPQVPHAGTRAQNHLTIRLHNNGTSEPCAAPPCVGWCCHWLQSTSKTTVGACTRTANIVLLRLTSAHATHTSHKSQE
jgi:hypothetical protein